MSREGNVTVLKKAIELINSGETDEGVHTLFADGVVDHDLAPGQGPGREGLRDFFRTLHGAFPDLRLEQRHVTAGDEHVSMAFTVSGTHRGDFNGVAPTGRNFAVSGVEIFRFAGGKVVERWGLTDDMGILGQLGLVSPPH
jgi:steroid delta-isomerase-like uncharacterized protein